MIGTTLEESKMFTALDPNLSKLNDAESKKALVGYLGRMGLENDKIISILETYKEARKGRYSTEAKEILSALITDVIFRNSTIRLLEAQSSHQRNTYNYIFTWKSPAFDGILGSCHALELPFVFGTYHLPKIDEFAGKGPDVEVLSHKIMDAWISFARTGNPNHDGIPKWPSYDNEKRATMFLGKEWKVVNAAFDKERAAWDGLLKI